MQSPTVGEKHHVEHDDNTLRKMVYGPTYVPYNKDGQKLLLPQTTDMSRKDNLNCYTIHYLRVCPIMNMKA